MNFAKNIFFETAFFIFKISHLYVDYKIKFTLLQRNKKFYGWTNWNIAFLILEYLTNSIVKFENYLSRKPQHIEIVDDPGVNYITDQLS